MTKNLLKFLPIYQLLFHYISTFRLNLYMFTMKLKLRSLGKYCRIYYANITEPYNVTIGHHVYINKNCDIVTTGSAVEIGNYIMIGPNVTFVAQNHDVSNWRKPMLLENKYKRGKIEINDDVWIGANSTILSGVSVGRGSVIAAGSVVTKNVSDYVVVGGVPAKKIKDRIPTKYRKTAMNIDFDRYKNEKIDWKNWGVGKIV